MQIVYSNAHESLLAILCEKILNSQSLRHVIVFPSQALKVFYSDELCERLGSTLSLDLILPDEIHEISIELRACSATKSVKRSWRASDYRLALLQIFLEFEKQKERGLLEPLLKASPLEMALQKDPHIKSALASSLASLFCGYSHWALSKECFDKPVTDWQSFLWNRVHQILDPEQALAYQWLDLAEHMKPLAQDEQLHLVGFSQAAPSFLKWVEKAQGSTPALWYVHSPSRLYWHDLESYLRGQKQLARLSASSSAYDQLQALLLDRNPLLASLCQVARPLMQYLETRQSDLVDAYELFGSVENHPAYQELWWQGVRQQDKALTILSALQADLLLMRPLHELSAFEISESQSLNIYKCSCLDNEMASVLQRIEDLIACDESLEPSDFMVLAPDIHLYRGFIERYFDPLSLSLPYKIFDSTPEDATGAKSFMLSLLSFSTGLWSWENFLALLEEPWAVANIQSLKIARWFESIGPTYRVSWGLNQKHRELLAQENDWNLVEESEKGSWRSFWSFIFENAVLSQDDDSGLLLRVEEQEVRVAKQFFGVLEKGLEPWIKRNCLTPSQWFERLESLLKELSSSSLDAFEFLQFIKTHLPAYGTGPLSAQDFNELLASHLEDLPNVWTSKREGLLRFASLQPMRALPVKHLFIMGLSQMHFPAGAAKMGYEWTFEEGIGQRPNSSEVLRFAFLESLLSARESLTLTYSGNLQMQAVPCAMLANLLAYLKVSFKSAKCHQSGVEPRATLVSEHSESASIRERPLNLPPWLKPVKDLPSVVFLHQLQWALSDPLRLHLDYLWQIRASKQTDEGQSVSMNRSFLETYSRLAQMDQKIEVDKLLAQWEKGALSHLETDTWKHRLERHREYRREYLGLELQEPQSLVLSQGRRWLGLKDEWQESILYTSSLIIGDSPCFEIVGHTPGFDPKQPQISIKSASKDARNDLLKALVPLAIGYEKGLIQNRQVLLIPRKKTEKVKTWDLACFDSQRWLACLARYLTHCFSSPILYTNDLYTQALSDSQEEYEEDLCLQIQEYQNKKSQNYSLQYMWGLFQSDSDMWKMCLKNSFEILNQDLKELYSPIFDIYPLQSKKERDDEEL